MEQTDDSIEIKYANIVKRNIIYNIKTQIKKLNETHFSHYEKQLQQQYQDELYTLSLIDYEKQSQKIKDYHFNYLKNMLTSTTGKSSEKYYRIAELNQIRCELNNYYIDANFYKDNSDIGKQVKYILSNFVYE